MDYNNIKSINDIEFAQDNEANGGSQPKFILFLD